MTDRTTNRRTDRMTDSFFSSYKLSALPVTTLLLFGPVTLLSGSFSFI